jgi:hypothetical protein
MVLPAATYIVSQAAPTKGHFRLLFLIECDQRGQIRQASAFLTNLISHKGLLPVMLANKTLDNSSFFVDCPDIMEMI